MIHRILAWLLRALRTRYAVARIRRFLDRLTSRKELARAYHYNALKLLPPLRIHQRR